MSIAALTLAMLFVAQVSRAVEPPSICPAPGSWLVPGTTESLSTEQVIRAATGKRVILLGEIHDNAAHHRWQLHTLAGVHAHHPNLVLGLEMFPRSAQSVLDQYTAGELTDDELLDQADWQRVWNFPAEYYLPLFRFARMHRLPMLALNIERELVSQVSAQGWAQVPQDERQGVDDPAPASDAYLESLLAVFGNHSAAAEDSQQPTLDTPSFQRFVQAQQVWDRAMAQAIASALADTDDEIKVVGIIGRGHLQYRHGVSHQLDDLGVDDSYVLLPWDIEPEGCQAPPAGLADATFAIEPPAVLAPAPRPRLGVHITDAEAGVEIQHIADESVALAAGLEEADIIRSAAGQSVGNTADLIEIVSRQAPGTWLPITVVRDGETMEIIARFPTEFK